MGFPDGSVGKEPTCQFRRHKRGRFDHWVRKIHWKRKWQLTSVFLPGESHGPRRLGGYSPWGAENQTPLSMLACRRSYKHHNEHIIPLLKNRYNTAAVEYIGSRD